MGCAAQRTLDQPLDVRRGAVSAGQTAYRDEACAHGVPSSVGAAKPTATGKVVSIDDSAGTRTATVELTVTLADGTVTLTGDAVVALD